MEKYRKSNENNEFEMSTPTWNGEFELPNGSCSLSDIQDYFEYISKKPGEKTNNSHYTKIHISQVLEYHGEYHLSINFSAQKQTLFPISKKFKTRTFQ